MLPMTTLSLIEVRRLAAEIEVDPRSVNAVLAGRHVRGVAGDKIRRALAARGVALPAVAPVPLAAAAMRAGGRPF